MIKKNYLFFAQKNDLTNLQLNQKVTSLQIPNSNEYSEDLLEPPKEIRKKKVFIEI